MATLGQLNRRSVMVLMAAAGIYLFRPQPALALVRILPAWPIPSRRITRASGFRRSFAVKLGDKRAAEAHPGCCKTPIIKLAIRAPFPGRFKSTGLLLFQV
jgi:hypothetical protein